MSNGDNVMDLETLIRDNSWFKCDKCEYKAKSEMSLRKLKEAQHAFSCEENISGVRCETCKFAAETKIKLQNHEVINHTVEDDNWNGVW